MIRAVAQGMTGKILAAVAALAMLGGCGSLAMQEEAPVRIDAALQAYARTEGTEMEGNLAADRRPERAAERGLPQDDADGGREGRRGEGNVRGGVGSPARRVLAARPDDVEPSAFLGAPRRPAMSTPGKKESFV